MRHRLFVSVSLAALLLSCAHDKAQRGHAAEEGARASAQGEERVDLPQSGRGRGRMASARHEVPAEDADNTAINARDREGQNITPLDQGNDEADIDLTQRIRKAVVADDSLSFTARNVKIVTLRGHVTLRGTVTSEAEKDAIFKTAVREAGVGKVTNELEVSND